MAKQQMDSKGRCIPCDAVYGFSNMSQHGAWCPVCAGKLHPTSLPVDFDVVALTRDEALALIRAQIKMWWERRITSSKWIEAHCSHRRKPITYLGACGSPPLTGDLRDGKDKRIWADGSQNTVLQKLFRRSSRWHNAEVNPFADNDSRQIQGVCWENKTSWKKT